MRRFKRTLLLGALAFLAEGGVHEALAGEAARLSDVPVAPPTAEQAEILRLRRQQQSVLPSRANSSRPSLEPVNTMPFQTSPRSSPGITLTPRDLERLDQNKNWLFQDPSETGLTEENLQRALGVRSLEGEEGSLGAGNEARTAMERYVENQRSAAGESEDTGNIQDEGDRMAWMQDSASMTSPFGAYPATPEALRNDPLYLELTGLDNRLDPELERTLRAVRESGQDVRDALHQAGRGQVFGLETRSLRDSLQPGAARESDRGLGSLGGLLDSEAVSSPIGPRVGSVLDPVNAYPDLTRQELNPVVVRPTGLGDSLTPKPVFSDLQNARNSLARTPGRGLSDLMGPAPGRGSLMPSMSSPQDSLQPMYSPTKDVRRQLTLPGRAF